MRRLAFLLLVVAVGCSDRKLVADATAAYQYAETHYEWSCVAVKGPPECKQDREELMAAKQEVTLCNQVQKVGALPGIARKRLRAIKRDLPK